MSVKLGEYGEFTESEVEAYLDDLETNNYCTVLSDYYEKLRESIVSGIVNQEVEIDEQTATKIFNEYNRERVYEHISLYFLFH